MLTKTVQQAGAMQRARMAPELQPGEPELLQAFATHDLVQEALRRRSEELKGIHGGAKGARVPSTLRAVERRWFVGRQTVQKAAQKALELLVESIGALTPEGVAKSDALVGTATLLALSQDGRGLVTLKPHEITSPAAEGIAAGPYRELQLCVSALQRGGSTTKGARPRRPKTYFLHQDVVAACLRHAERFQQRQQVASSTMTLATVPAGSPLAPLGLAVGLLDELAESSTVDVGPAMPQATTMSAGSREGMPVAPLESEAGLLDELVESSTVDVEWDIWAPTESYDPSIAADNSLDARTTSTRLYRRLSRR